MKIIMHDVETVHDLQAATLFAEEILVNPKGHWKSMGAMRVGNQFFTMEKTDTRITIRKAGTCQSS